jgi:SAM-dependent methyltransferase
MRGKFAWSRCRECGFLIGDVRAVQTGGGYDRLDMPAYDRSIGQLRTEEAPRLVELAAGQSPTPHTWLDVGCGVGRLVEEVCKHGYVVRGVEPDPMARHLAQSRNPGAAIVENILALDEEATGVVSMLDVLEHVPSESLAEMAARVRRHLAATGLWMIKVPSSDGPYFRAVDLLSRLFPAQAWPFIERLWLLRFASPHFVYFNEKSARRFLHRNGFEVLAVTYFAAIPLRSALARLTIDDTIPRWKAILALPVVAVLNLLEMIAGRSDSLILLARPNQAG